MDDSRKRISAFAPLLFLAISAIAQVIGFAAALFFGRYLAVFDLLYSVQLQLLLHLMVVVLILRWQSLPLSWQLMNVLVPILAQTHLPWQIFALLTLIALLVYLPAFWTRVPYYPTNRVAYEAIANLLPADAPFTMIDLGCGFGSLLRYLSKKRPNGKIVGVEISPLPFIVAKIRFLFNCNVDIKMKNFWRLSLQPYEYVYAFLAPHPMEELWKKFSHEGHKNGIFITNSFAINREPDYAIALDCPRQPKLMVFRKRKNPRQ